MILITVISRLIAARLMKFLSRVTWSMMHLLRVMDLLLTFSLLILFPGMDVNGTFLYSSRRLEFSVDIRLILDRQKKWILWLFFLEIIGTLARLTFRHFLVKRNLLLGRHARIDLCGCPPY